jgi:uncharacterized protein
MMIWTNIYASKGRWVQWPIVLLSVALAVWICCFVWPIPDTYLRITTGNEQGAYFQMAKRYQDLLEQRGITLQVLSSEGTPDNLKRLQSDPPQAELAFAQGGFGLLGTAFEQRDTSKVMTLANIAIEPLWLISRQSDLTNLLQIRGLKVGVGGGQSGSRMVLLRLLELYRIRDHELQLVTLNGFDLVKGLQSGQVDAVFHVATPESPVVRGLLDIPGVHLAQLARTRAIVERLPYLEPRLLTQGAMLGTHSQPAKDTTLLSTYASLVAHSQLHPTLQRELLYAADQVHRGAGLFHRASEFPSHRQLDFPAPINDPVSTGTDTSLSAWERLLPFFWTQVLLRMLLVVIPLALLAGWLCWWLPIWIGTRLRGELDRMYGQLQFLEEDMQRSNQIRLDYERYRRQLVDLDQKISRMKIPQHLTRRWLALRAHVDFVNRSSYRLRGR